MDIRFENGSNDAGRKSAEIKTQGWQTEQWVQLDSEVARMMSRSGVVYRDGVHPFVKAPTLEAANPK